jgi:UDP-2,3-diacylglucosamine pyrophosphatase LpxH
MTYLTNSVQSGRLRIKKSDEQSDQAAGTTLTEESLEAPHKIILLGDMLDLWISRDSNTLRPYQESFNIFNSLIALNREIVWLLGNHDGIMEHYEGTHYLPDGAPFSVFCGGYPNGKGSEGRCKGEHIGGQGEPIGGRTYFFLHGHQFDFFFRHGSVLRFGNFVGFSSATARDFKRFMWLGGIVLLLTVFVVLSPLLNNWLPTLFASMVPFEQNSTLAVLTLFVWWLIGAIAFLGVLWLFTSLAKLYYDYSHHPGHIQKGAGKPSTLRMQIQQRVGCYDFPRVAQRIDADVIVCGHTHESYIKSYTPKNGPKKLVVNSGSWIVQPNSRTHDTFVYIDNNGLRVLQWQDDSGCVSQIMSSFL